MTTLFGGKGDRGVVLVIVGRGVRVIVRVGVAIEAGVAVEVGLSVIVDGAGVGAGAQPLNKTMRNTNARKIDPINFFMTLSPFDLIAQETAEWGERQVRDGFLIFHITLLATRQQCMFEKNSTTAFALAPLG